MSEAPKQKASKLVPSTAKTSAITKQLETEDEHIQLAVELIYLLESNEIPAGTVLKALDIVQADFHKKLTN